MAGKTGPKEATALSNYFAKRYSERYGIKIKFNRNKARWSWDNMLLDMTMNEAEALVDYYFTTTGAGNGHELDWFFYNYEKLMEAKVKVEDDRAALAVIREQSRIRTEEWKNKLND